MLNLEVKTHIECPNRIENVSIVKQNDNLFYVEVKTLDKHIAYNFETTIDQQQQKYIGVGLWSFDMKEFIGSVRISSQVIDVFGLLHAVVHAKNGLSFLLFKPITYDQKVNNVIAHWKNEND